MDALLFAMGDTDEYPLWALPLVYRRMFWQEYGVVLPDFGYEEVITAIRLQSLEAQRQSNLSKRKS